jgi:hypothetical protein
MTCRDVGKRGKIKQTCRDRDTEAYAMDLTARRARMGLRRVSQRYKRAPHLCEARQTRNTRWSLSFYRGITGRRLGGYASKVQCIRLN